MSGYTIKDIAQRLSISPSTVSRALSDHPDISEKTKKNVNRIAEELNYNPNIIAQSLKSKKTKTIGVILPEIDHHFFSAALTGIEEVAYNSGFTIMLCRSNEDVNREIINLNALFSNRVAGVIASISQTTINGDHFNNILQKKVPIVFFDRVLNDVNASKVVINDKKSAYEAVSFMIKKGYKKIAHFSGSNKINISVNRLEGYLQALNENNIPINENWIISGGLHEDDGAKAMEKLKQLKELPEAIFAINDPVAIGALKKIKEYGMRIPEDMAIMGFSNNPICEMLIPTLTSIHQPAYEMGKNAAEIIIDNIVNNRPLSDIRNVVLETELIVRQSI